MKTTRYAVAVTILAIWSLAGNFYAVRYITSQADAVNALKEECSLFNNVHISNCVIKAIDVSEKQPERIVYKTADLLPPPSYN